MSWTYVYCGSGGGFFKILSLERLPPKFAAAIVFDPAVLCW